MAVARGLGVYRLIKARMDFVQGGDLTKVFWYSLLDAGSIRLFHGRGVAKDENDLPHGIKTPWRDFCAFIDNARIPFPVPPSRKAAESEAEDVDLLAIDGSGELALADREEPEEVSLSSEVLMLMELKKNLEDSGIYDVKEENLTKIRYLEEAFARIGGGFNEEGCVAFIKVESLSTMEAEELMNRFPEESAREDFWSNRKLGDSEKKKSKSAPKAVFPCFAVVAPIGGIPAVELSPGDTVSLAVPPESLLYSIVKYQRGGAFSGDMDVVLSSVRPGGSERIILEFVLSEELAAVAVVQSNLRVRAVKGSRPRGASVSWEISPAMQQGFAVTAVALVALIFILLLFVR
ncbi:hypothetical protein [Dethiosulfovibrio salsuginis]|uniref:Uncharacterized protein n=1 Tax=Dethiosulfovibrio salsuginis TaxID=561720 RepID=A0A1X7IIM6_9BACT|nr:hypothetical protein [Dethiosulfovibrio salsuginis]SMG14665.1 hypothetical protein SAMN06275492_102100 [Dethiosulfovibrio salsuginis]